MKIYLAALIYNDFRVGSTVWHRLNDREKRAVVEVPHILDSYHYVHKPRMIERIRGTGRKIFLDSGAFSAYTQGAHIDVRQYAQYIRENQDFIEVASVLDAIGDPDQTYINQMTLERHGAQVLPCYHYGEPEEVLQYYIENYDYITIGGMVPVSGAQLKIWLDRIWGRYLTNPDGTAKLKVHGFGMTSISLMARYPWYSVDSSSWVQIGGIGRIFLPPYNTALSVSDTAPQLKEAGYHIDNLVPEQRDEVMEYIEGLGFEIDRLRVSHWSRKCFNIVTFGSMMEKQLEGKTFIQQQPMLF